MRAAECDMAQHRCQDMHRRAYHRALSERALFDEPAVKHAKHEKIHGYQVRAACKKSEKHASGGTSDNARILAGNKRYCDDYRKYHENDGHDEKRKRSIAFSRIPLIRGGAFSFAVSLGYCSVFSRLILRGLFLTHLTSLIISIFI